LKADQIRALSSEELLRKLAEAHEELLKLRFRLATRQLTNYHEITRVKKRIAKIKTILRGRELNIE